MDSVSKRYSMCGARIGALISKNHQFMEMALKFGQARLSPPTLGQIAGEAALKPLLVILMMYRLNMWKE